MHLLPQWRVLTVGDGDLSFSLALSQRWPSIQLTATVLDSETEVRNKYALNAIDELQARGQQVLFNMDITRPKQYPKALTGQDSAKFDVSIFQFPLVPNAGPRRPGQSWHQSDDSNLQNRKLLHRFLTYSRQHLLAPEGANLCYITSKDVKPYCDWNIEALGKSPNPKGQPHNAPPYLGKTPFNPQDFPGYRVRNVDRDKQVKSTAATTYIWGPKLPENWPEAITPLTPETQNYCPLCNIGPVENPQDWQNHLNSKLHRRRAEYQRRWEQYWFEEEGV